MINIVYETVLAILNKEQRGYITPDEFNKLAIQSQREIFESYFSKDYRSELSPEYPGEYGDPNSNIEERISVFQTFSSELTKTGDIISYPEDFYRLGSIQTSSGVLLDEVSIGRATFVNRSQYTKPTTSQPIFVRVGGGVRTYPDFDADQISMSYLKTPSDPNWTYNLAAFNDDGDVIFDSNADGYNDFELHESEQHELVLKILTYSGLITREQAIAQLAAQMAAQTTQTEQ